MKIGTALIVLLLVVIAIYVAELPSGKQIGEGIIAAQREEESRREWARYEHERQLRAEQVAEASARDRAAQQALAQDEFDALPKWDTFGRPVNRTPPSGLQPTAALPPPPQNPLPIFTPKPVQDPAQIRAEIERKFGAPPAR